MHDRYSVLCVLALLLPVAALIVAGCILGGSTTGNALFAALKLVVIK